MKSNLILILIVLLGLVLIVAAGILWHLSRTTEFTRVGQAMIQQADR